MQGSFVMPPLAFASRGSPARSWRTLATLPVSVASSISRTPSVNVSSFDGRCSRGSSFNTAIILYLSCRGRDQLYGAGLGRSPAPVPRLPLDSPTLA